MTRTDDNRTVGSSSSAIVGPTWHVISVVTPDGMSHPGYGPATLHIDARGRLTATDGCNTLGADVVVRAHTIAFPHGVAKTEIACLRPGATFAWTANTVDSVLKGAARWNVSAARLTISRHGAGSVTYGKSASNNSVEPTLLPGTWQLTSIEREIGNSGSAEGSSAMGTKITISGKMLKVTHACYVNRAAISVGRGRLTIRNVTLDRAIPCPSNAGSKYDGTVDDVLTGTCTWKFVENSLWITKGKVWLTFTR
jgi:heat shock protein HslJ